MTIKSSGQKIYRSILAIDWKIIAALFLLAAAVSVVQQQHVSNERDAEIKDLHSLLKDVKDNQKESNDTIEVLISNSSKSDHKQNQMKHQITILSRLLKQNNLPVPASAIKIISEPTNNVEPHEVVKHHAKAHKHIKHTSGGHHKPTTNPSPVPPCIADVMSICIPLPTIP